MRYSRLSYPKQARILKCFCEDVTAASAAVIVGFNRNENEFVGGKCHVNGIEAFGSFAKRRSQSSTVVLHKH
jgi:hypothetical protein